MFTSPQRRLLIESDIDKRRLERQSVHGDEEAQSKELVMKMRNGILTQEQVKLLSYLNYKPAQQLIPVEPPNDLKEFVDGLEPWGRGVLVKAAVVSASSVLHVFENAYPDDYSPRRALKAAISGDNNAYAAYAADIAVASATDAYASRASYASYAADAVAAAAYTYSKVAYVAYVYASRAAYKASMADPSLDIRGIIEKELIDWTLNGH